MSLGSGCGGSVVLVLADRAQVVPVGASINMISGNVEPAGR